MPDDDDDDRYEPEALSEMKRIAQTLPAEQASRLLACTAWVRKGLELARDLTNELIELADDGDEGYAGRRAIELGRELRAAAETVREEKPADEPG